MYTIECIHTVSSYPIVFVHSINELYYNYTTSVAHNVLTNMAWLVASQHLSLGPGFVIVARTHHTSQPS